MNRHFPLAFALAASAAQAQVTYSNTNDASLSLVNGESLCQDYCSATSAPDPTNPNRLLIGFGVGYQGSCMIGDRSYLCWSDQAFHVGTQSFVARQRVDRICSTATAADGQYISNVLITQRGSSAVGARGGHVSGLAAVSIDNVQVYAGGAFNVYVERSALQEDVDARRFHTKLDICIFTSLSATNENFVYGRRTIIGSADARIFETNFLVETLPIPPLPVADPAPAPVVDPAPAPVVEPAPAPVVEPAPAPVVEPAPAPVVEPAPAPVVEPAPAPVAEAAPAPQ